MPVDRRGYLPIRAALSSRQLRRLRVTASAEVGGQRTTFRLGLRRGREGPGRARAVRAPVTHRRVGRGDGRRWR